MPRHPPVRDPLSKIVLDEVDLIDEGIHDGVQVWFTSDGDVIELHHFPIPPDLPSGQPSIDEFCAEFRATMPQ